jgi:hypothetical protein
LRFLICPGDEVGRVGLFIQAVAWLHPEFNYPMQLIFGEANEITDHVCDEVLAGAGALKVERQQRRGFGRDESFGGSKTGHATPPRNYTMSF